MLRKAIWAVCFLVAALRVDGAAAFCGFYVAKADTKLFNESSQVVLIRDGDRTVLTMANDFQGDPLEFAMVVPVPTFIEREQIHVGDKAVIDHLDAYTAPRLVEYFDENPCNVRYLREMASSGKVNTMEELLKRKKAVGVSPSKPATRSANTTS